MSLDSDLVRVDLLKAKRLIYLSYPEGSQERKDFLYASKLSELNYLTKLVPPDVADFVFGEYAKLRKFELISIGFSIILGVGISIAMFGMHRSFPHAFLWKFWYGGLSGGLLDASRHIWHMVRDWRKVQPFKVEYETLSKKIEKLTKELKGLIQ
jgi:hypothetical protein